MVVAQIAPFLVGVLVIAAVLFQQRAHRLSNLFFICLVACVSYLNVTLVLLASGEIENYLWLLPLREPLRYLVPPLLYFYVRSFADPGFGLKPRHAWCFLPAGLWLSGSLFHHLTDNPSAQWLLRFHFRYWVPDALCLLHSGVYLALALRSFQATGASLRVRYRNGAYGPSGWLKFFLGSFAVMWIVALFDFLNHDNVVFLKLLIAAISINLCGTAVYLMLGSPILVGPAEREKKYRTSKLDEYEIGIYRAEVRELLETQRLFLHQDLSQKAIANRLGLSSHHLSQVFSEGFGSHFYDIINAYRIEEAKQRFRSGETRVLNVAMACGFNSKSAFNSAFKKFTGLTPTAFIRELRSPPE